MRSILPSLVFGFLALLGGLRGEAAAQSFQIVPSQVNIVVAPEFKHADVLVPIAGTEAGFNFGALSVTSDASWVVPTIDTTTHDVVLKFNTAGLLNSSYTATVTVSGGGTTDFFSVRATLGPLNIIKFVDDPIRSRTYGIQQDGLNAGAVVVIDPITNTKINCVTVGRKPTDMAVSPDGSELMVISSSDHSLTAIDLATLRVKETILLTTYVNWGDPDTSADVAYGPGNIIYYSDGSWAPVLYVFNRSSKQVIQQVTDANEYGFGDFALSPDGSELYGWVQYGWTAGYAGSNLTKYTVGTDGKLTFSQRTTYGYPTPLMRDPLDTPVLVDSAGAHVFVKQVAVDPDALTQNYRVFPGPVYSISPGGEVAVTASSIVQVSTNISLLQLPVSTSVHTITSDYARLVYFNKTARTIGTINLLEAIGPQVLGRNLSPADGAITLSPSKLEWAPLPGVDTYRVYLSNSKEVVENAGPSSPAFLGAVNTPSINIQGTLVAGTTYYWRIDAVTSAGTAKGEIYEFTVSPIATDLVKIDTATVQGHATHQVDVQLTSANAGLEWNASADETWVGFAATTGTTPGKLSVVLNASNLSPGLHTATVTVRRSSNGNVAFTLPVTLEVDPLAISLMESDRNSALVYAISEEAVQSPYGGVTIGSGNRAYLLEIDSASKSIKRVVRVGNSVTDLALHYAENRIYVTNWRPGSLLAIDRSTFKQVQGYGFAAYPSTYYENDVFRVAAGAQGRVMVEEMDQWINVTILDTVSGSKVNSINLRQGGGKYSPNGRYYYHGDDNISNAEIHKYDVIGDAFSEVAHIRVSSVGYYGSRTVVMSGDGERVFWNGGAFDKDLNLVWNVADEIYATSTDGRYAFSEKTVYDINAKAAVLAMPIFTKVSAYNSTTNQLVVQSGGQVKFFAIGGSTPLAAPVLSYSNLGTTSVQLSWTDETLETSFTLQNRKVGETDWTDLSSTIPANQISYTAVGLLANQAYEFRIKANSGIQASDWSNIVTLTTGAPTLPSAVTLAATNVGIASATLNGTVNPNGRPASAYFEYGTTTSYGSSMLTSPVGSGTEPVTISRNLNFLAAGTTYHYRLVVEGADGTVTGVDLTFTTAPAKPTVNLSGVVDLTSTSVTLSAYVNPNGNSTTAHFEYGTTTALDQSTANVGLGSGIFPEPFTQSLNGLSPDTTYYYRVVAVNVGGSTASNMLSFKTAPEGNETEFLIANDDLTFTARRQPRIVDVLANDVGAPRPQLHIQAISTAAAGSATSNPDGTITYVPGAAFAGFDTFTYTVADTTGRTATATVIVEDTYLNCAGTYHALVGSYDSSYGSSGSISVNVTRTGAITGVLWFGGERVALKTSLRYDGIASFEVTTALQGTLVVSLQIDPEGQQLTGSVSGLEGPSAFAATRNPYNVLNPAPQASRYTLLLPPDSASPALQGYGFATMTVKATGAVQIQGRTATGAPFNTVASIGEDARFPLYAVARKTSQSLHGWVRFRNLAASSDCDGTIGTSSSSTLEAGQHTLIGSRYFPAAPGLMVLPFESKAENATLDFGQGIDLATIPVTLSTKGLAYSGTELTQLRLNKQTGLFSGQFHLLGKPAPFYGVTFQRQEMGAGVMVSKSGAGWVRLDAAGVEAPAETFGDVTQKILLEPM